MSKVDCRYCEYAVCDKPTDSECDCFVEDGCYFDHHVEKPEEEAKQCKHFLYCDVFPKN